MPSISLLRTSMLALAAGFLQLSQANPAVRYSWPLYGGEEYCQTFAKELNLKNTDVKNVTYYPNAQTVTVPLPGADATCSQSADVSVPLCRLSLLVHTSSSSQVKMEIWLPDDWSGRVAAVGNGGLNGCIDYKNLNYLSSFNFAVVGSNNGHDGTGGAPFLNAPEVIKDFAYRAIHTEAVISKTVVKKYYSRPASKAYYVGCSTGGRQGFKMIQDFPDDFDGVLAGAPAIDFNHLSGWSGRLSRYNGAPSGTPTISVALWEAVRLDIVTQCDKLDGVEDGIIDDPDLCDYDPKGLICDAEGTEADQLCLSESQAEVVRKVFSPLLGEDGELLYPRYDPGTSFSGAAQLIFGGNLFPYSLDWWKYVIYNDTSYNGTDFGLRAIHDADAVNPAGIQTWNPDLSAFAKRGGKVITYHGRQDSLIAGGNSVRWYNLVNSTMGQKSMKNFYRFFPVPGMDHCNGGPGGNAFGQVGASFQGLPKDKRYNVVLALVDWVENGNAPEGIIGTKFINDTVALGVDSRRVHCALPKKSVLVKGGDWKEAQSWECV